LYITGRVERGELSLEEQVTVSRRVKDRHFQLGNIYTRIFSAIPLIAVKKWKQY
jgi:hypothetical protein